MNPLVSDSQLEIKLAIEESDCKRERVREGKQWRGVNLLAN